MKREWIKILVLCICILLLIPWSITRWQKDRPNPVDYQIRVLMPNGKIQKLNLEEYLVGVVAAEMPAQFDDEALKSQAVAARTFSAKRLSKLPYPDPGYDVDTTVLTQAWISEAQMKEKWNWLGYWRYHSKIKKAVEATQGQVLISNGEYIDAFYHSSSGRKQTERSEEVWSSPRPYLKNINSGEETPLRFVKNYTFTPALLASKLGIAAPSHFSSSDFQVLTYTAAGRAKDLKILGKVYTAVQLRTLLNLASTDIEWTIKPDSISIKTYGNGHAVGMSQYGANDLARKGKSYEEILGYYYPGSKILSLAQPK
ncbi:MAG: stage II sporulation protein D [Desulfitobacterium hafniense]|nr:stage II sporulation protein D [Desulfitobacterium hafniense]